MRAWMVPLMLLVAGLGAAGTAARAVEPATPRPAPKQPVVLGYYASWGEFLKPAAIRYDRFTHLAHAFVEVDREQGKVVERPAIPNDELIRRAHAAGVKVLLSVGGAESGAEYLNEKGANAEWRRSLVRSLVDTVVKAKYDGVDVDWEFPAVDGQPEQSKVNAANMSLFVVELDAELRKRAPEALVAMAIPAGHYNGQWFRPEALAPHVNFVNVMTYDFHGSWSGHSGHNAPLFPVAEDKEDGAVTNTTAGMSYARDTLRWPKEKLLVGTPSYGRQFEGRGLHQPFGPDAKCVDVPYREAVARLGSGWRSHWDEAAKVPWLDHPDLPQLVTYENPRSAQEKGRWAKEQKFGGIFFWEISQDFVNGDHALVKAAKDGLTGAPR